MTQIQAFSSTIFLEYTRPHSSLDFIKLLSTPLTWYLIMPFVTLLLPFICMKAYYVQGSWVRSCEANNEYKGAGILWTRWAHIANQQVHQSRLWAESLLVLEEKQPARRWNKEQTARASNQEAPTLIFSSIILYSHIPLNQSKPQLTQQWCAVLSQCLLFIESLGGGR